jgi:hypothetical protein
MKPAIEKGEKCYNARLTAEQVHEARILVMKGPIGTLPQIARRWGVEKQTLRNARSRVRTGNGCPCRRRKKLKTHRCQTG